MKSKARNGKKEKKLHVSGFTYSNLEAEENVLRQILSLGSITAYAISNDVINLLKVAKNSLSF